ncbi:MULTISPECIES: hypothetical protein [Spirulina sp. CCY15215]|nr:hypothetical protein [Spirulina major]
MVTIANSSPSDRTMGHFGIKGILSQFAIQFSILNIDRRFS